MYRAATVLLLVTGGRTCCPTGWADQVARNRHGQLAGLDDLAAQVMQTHLNVDAWAARRAVSSPTSPS
jgi:hypothetical protein